MNRLIIIVYDLEKFSYTLYWIYMIILQREFDFASSCVTNVREEKERDGRLSLQPSSSSPLLSFGTLS